MAEPSMDWDADLDTADLLELLASPDDAAIVAEVLATLSASQLAAFRRVGAVGIHDLLRSQQSPPWTDIVIAGAEADALLDLVGESTLAESKSSTMAVPASVSGALAESIGVRRQQLRAKAVDAIAETVADGGTVAKAAEAVLAACRIFHLLYLIMRLEGGPASKHTIAQANAETAACQAIGLKCGDLEFDRENGKSARKKMTAPLRDLFKVHAQITKESDAEELDDAVKRFVNQPEFVPTKWRDELVAMGLLDGTGRPTAQAKQLAGDKQEALIGAFAAGMIHGSTVAGIMRPRGSNPRPPQGLDRVRDPTWVITYESFWLSRAVGSIRARAGLRGRRWPSRPAHQLGERRHHRRGTGCRDAGGGAAGKGGGAADAGGGAAEAARHGAHCEPQADRGVAGRHRQHRGRHVLRAEPGAVRGDGHTPAAAIEGARAPGLAGQLGEEAAQQQGERATSGTASAAREQPQLAAVREPRCAADLAPMGAVARAAVAMAVARRRVAL